MHWPLRRWRSDLAGLLRLPEPESVVAADENFDEDGYLEANWDVAEAVLVGTIASGRNHYSMFGKHEGRRLMHYPRTRLDGLPLLRDWYRMRIVLGRVVRGQRQLGSRLYETEVELRQLRDMLELVHGCAPPPPKHLQLRVVGNYGDTFVRSGFTLVAPMLNRALRSAGRQLSDFGSILDFGCGCGRATFALSRLAPEADLHATDIDEEAIGWLQDHVAQLATFTVCPTHPPTPYGDETFDFVFGISVLTHLPEDMQFAWLAELARIVKVGGHVVLTTHGEQTAQDLQEEERREFDRTGFLYVPSGYGRSISLPDFYENTFHSREYIRREWARYFDVLDIQDPDVGGHQDVVLLRRRS